METDCLHFILHVMSDKAAFVSGALVCLQRYRGNLYLSRSNSASRQRMHLHIYATTNIVSLWDYGSFTAIHVIRLAIKKNKQYIPLHLSVHSKSIYFQAVDDILSKTWFSQKNNNNNITTLTCLAISVRAKVLRDPLVQYSQGLNWYGNIDELAVLARGGAILKHCLSCSPITTHWDS